MFLQVVGDECISTNEDIIRAEEKQTFNCIALTLAKAKTVSGFIGLWQKAERWVQRSTAWSPPSP